MAIGAGDRGGRVKLDRANCALGDPSARITTLEQFPVLELRLQTEGGWTTYAWCDVPPKWSRLADLGERYVNAGVAIDYEVIPESGLGFSREEGIRQMVLSEALARSEGRKPRPWSEWAVERPKLVTVPIIGPPGEPLVHGVDSVERAWDGQAREPTTSARHAMPVSERPQGQTRSVPRARHQRP